MSKSSATSSIPTSLADKYGAEALRYYLMSDIVTGKDSDFSEERLIQRYNTDLANSLGNLLNRTLSMAQRYARRHRELDPRHRHPVPAAPHRPSGETSPPALDHPRHRRSNPTQIEADRALEAHERGSRRRSRDPPLRPRRAPAHHRHPPQPRPAPRRPRHLRPARLEDGTPRPGATLHPRRSRVGHAPRRPHRRKTNARSSRASRFPPSRDNSAALRRGGALPRKTRTPPAPLRATQSLAMSERSSATTRATPQPPTHLP